MSSSCTKEVMGNKIQLQMINDLQCPGCIHGTDPETCSKYELLEDYNEKPKLFHCKNWRPSTFMGGVGRIALALPRGFCRTGMVEFGEKPFTYMRLYENPDMRPEYDRYNIPVWAMKDEYYLYVRVICPRNNWIFVDVIKDGTLEMASFKDGKFTHSAINVGEFYEEID